MPQFFGVAQFNSYYLCRQLSTYLSLVIDCCNDINNWWQQLIYLAPKYVLQNLTIHRWIKQKKYVKTLKWNCLTNISEFYLWMLLPILYTFQIFWFTLSCEIIYSATMKGGFYYNKVSTRYYNNSIILLSNIWFLFKLYLVQLPWCCYK